MQRSKADSPCLHFANPQTVARKSTKTDEITPSDHGYIALSKTNLPFLSAGVNCIRNAILRGTDTHGRDQLCHNFFAATVNGVYSKRKQFASHEQILSF